MVSKGGRFVLLRDFHHAYDLFPLKVIDTDGWIDIHVRSAIESALRDVCDDLITIELDDIRSKVEAATHASGHFIVTLDGGTYFDRFDFSFEITRTAFKIVTFNKNIGCF